MIASKKTFCVKAAVAALCALYATGAAIVAAPKNQIPVATMEVLPTSAHVLPVGAGTYIDYRLVGGNPCTAGEIASTGGVFMLLNRGLNGGFLGGDRCSPDAGGALIDRQYTVVIESAAACARIGAGDVPWVTAFDGTKCELTTPQGKAHSVEPGAIFKSRVTRSRVTFYINTPATDTVVAHTYRIQTDGDAQVTVENANQRLVNHTGAATLSVSEGGTYAAYEAFDLAFEMRFTRTMVTQ
jgi:hypothetical protein